jgi:hypothetical protein
MPAAAGLCQRKWDRADSEQRKEDKRTPKKVRRNRVFNLFLYIVVLRDLEELTEALRRMYECAYTVEGTLLARSEKTRQHRPSRRNHLQESRAGQTSFPVGG